MGGTEVYVAGLAQELQTLGIECVIAAPSPDGRANTSSYRNIRTVYYPGPWLDDPTQSVSDSAPADGLRDWLASERPDIYHQHDWSLNCGLTHLQAAKGLGIPTFMTVHLAKLVCVTRQMICEGRSQCDGQIIEQRCARCFMKSRAIPSWLAEPLAQIPGALAANLTRTPGVGRVLSGGPRARRTLTGLHRIAEATDCIVTVCEWLKSSLLINGVQAEKVVFVRTGVDPDVAAQAAPRARHGDVLRIGFIGRWMEAKGLNVLMAALQRLPKTIKFDLKVIGLAGTDKVDLAYRERMEKMVAGQPQYQFLTNQPRTAVNEFYKGIDVLAVPSQLLETGPLVVLEANAWKVPVIGSDLGGIREIVRHQVDGLLVPHANVDAWTDALRQLAENPALLRRFQENIGPVRTMRDTAHDMADLYRRRINR